MNILERNLQDDSYQKGMKLANAIARRLKQQGLRPDVELAGHFLRVDNISPGGKSSHLREIGGIYKDFQALGLSTDIISQIGQNRELIRRGLGVNRFRRSYDLERDDIFSKLSHKELDFLLRADIPDDHARKMIIQTLFIDRVYNHELLSLLDIEKETATLKETIEKDYGPEIYETEGEYANNNKYFEKATEIKPDPFREVQVQKYVLSQFCFCLMKLAQLPETFIWISNPEVELWIPDDIQITLKAISAMTPEKYFDRTAYLEGALRAFMRIYLDVSDDVALARRNGKKMLHSK